VSASVPTAEEFAALAARVAELEARLAAATTEPESPYMTIPEAALYIGSGYIACDGHRKKPCKGKTCRRCHGTGQLINRRRIDHLLSAGLIPRIKEGGRTLIRRTDLDTHLANSSNRRSKR
jgi:hypothetical protein